MHEHEANMQSFKFNVLMKYYKHWDFPFWSDLLMHYHKQVQTCDSLEKGQKDPCIWLWSPVVEINIVLKVISNPLE